MKMCIFDGCVREQYSRSFCSRHYGYLHRRGLLEVKHPRPYASRRRTRTVEERYWAKVDKSGECWTWTGARLSTGYGVFDLRKYPMGEFLAHRVAYRLAKGDILYTIDHLCRNRACVNPEHLEDVPLGENIARAWDHWRSTQPSVATA